MANERLQTIMNATHMLANIKTHHIYSDKFILSVVDLSKIDLATEEDKAYRIDLWARLFKSKTWEELKMCIKDDEYLIETAASLYEANAFDIVREQCLAREDAERRERTYERNQKLLTEENLTLKAEKATLEAEKIALEAYIKELEKKANR